MVDRNLNREDIKRFSTFDRQTGVFGITPYGQEGLEWYDDYLAGLEASALEAHKGQQGQKTGELVSISSCNTTTVVHPLEAFLEACDKFSNTGAVHILRHRSWGEGRCRTRLVNDHIEDDFFETESDEGLSRYHSILSG